ncbi:S-layer homology domain-containing protein [Ructibacterium gallinarum]|uniref:S-layer homology domain-containing protein n=1 Tax=Ructibacterium gallinarum TaxID=2779355 RepID=A0A9D5M4G1_9FIRM|nr:S-layer homology domain-containing protein [Ructibacterium gallinarum]MBE5040430.1 S-layer homology domain-containing protein [Ructibacterium gallinarum]
MSLKKPHFISLKTNFIIKFTAALTALFVFSAPFCTYADVLGTLTSQQATQFAQGTVFYTSTFEDASVGQQTEHYVAYTPNSDVVPILTNGASIYGKRTLTQANSYLNDYGIYSAMGMNADFFSFQTGVPMSNVVIDGRIVSKDSDWRPAIGFREDGSAFMGMLPIATTITTEAGSATIECINKYRQPYALYLYTKDFADNTHAPGTGINVVLGSLSGDITLNSSITAVVEAISEDDGSVPIPDDKLILSVDSSASQELKDRLNILQPGMTVTINTSEATGDARWNTAKYALGCLGGKLITNGQLDYEDESAAPRSAIGIRADGTVIFYTIDGRQSGYSYGVRKETLARRLLELGCVEAMNLDGGGSTSIGGVLPGTTDFTIMNSPSDGGLRSCANFFFLKKNNAPSGIPYVLNLSDWGKPVLSGSSIQLRIESAYDSSYGPAQVPSDAVFYLEQDAMTPSPDGVGTGVYENGYVTVRGNGDVYVAAKSGDAYGSTMLRAVATPDEIKIYNASTGEEVQELVMNPGDTIALSATAYWGGQAMVVDNSSFTWRVVSNDDSVGNITDDGFFTTSDQNGASGIVAVNAGLCTREIPVRIRETGEMPPPEYYPLIQGEIGENSFTARLTSQNGTISANEIHLTIDGTPATYQYDATSGILTYLYPENFDENYHRITLIVTDTAGASALAAFDLGNVSQNKNKFPDTVGHWADSYISYMAEHQVVNGSDDGMFHPNSSMTRTEFAIMLCNYLKINPEDYADTTLPFIDAGDIPWWAVNYVKAIYSLGIMQGQLNDYGVAFCPNDNIQRLEYAISVERLLPSGLATAPITATDEADIPFWGKESMKIATAQGILNGYPDGTLRPRQSVTRAEAVKILFTIFGAGK